MTDHELLELLYEALHADNKDEKKLGVLVRAESGTAVALRSRLYPIRRNHPDLACISIVLSPTAPDCELYLIRTPDNADATS